LTSFGFGALAKAISARSSCAVDVYSFEELANGLRADLRREAVVAELVLGLEIFLFGEELMLLQRGQTGSRTM
jgi:hypothetical protein